MYLLQQRQHSRGEKAHQYVPPAAKAAFTRREGPPVCTSCSKGSIHEEIRPISMYLLQQRQHSRGDKAHQYVPPAAKAAFTRREGSPVCSSCSKGSIYEERRPISMFLLQQRQHSRGDNAHQCVPPAAKAAFTRREGPSVCTSCSKGSIYEERRATSMCLLQQRQHSRGDNAHQCVPPAAKVAFTRR